MPTSRFAFIGKSFPRLQITGLDIGPTSMDNPLWVFVATEYFTHIVTVFQTGRRFRIVDHIWQTEL